MEVSPAEWLEGLERRDLEMLLRRRPEARSLVDTKEELAEQVGPRRVTQAELWLEGTMLVAQVNSEARLERLVTTLAGLGADPRVMSTERNDLAEVLTRSATTGGSRGSGFTLGEDAGPTAAGGRLGLVPEAVRAWEQAWVDQPVPRLGGLTPRAAARRPDVRQDLEVLLREMEHGAARGWAWRASIWPLSAKSSTCRRCRPERLVPLQ